MQRTILKTRKSFSKIQKQNTSLGVNNVEKHYKPVTIPSLNIPLNILGLKKHSFKRMNKLPIISFTKTNTNKSRYRLSSMTKLGPITPLKIQFKPCYQINQLENIKLIKQYSRDQLNSILKDDKPIQFLQNHLIKNTLRAKMVDWMIQVLASFKYSDKTFFQSVALMDKYYSNSSGIEDIKDLHLLGICCMFMIIKLQQISPLRLKTVVNKIAHKKISADTIINKQKQILNTLNFNILVPTLYDTITTTLCLWNSQTKQQPKQFQQLIDCSLYFAKMVVTDYKTISLFSKRHLTCSIIHLGFKLFKQTHQQFSIQDNIKKIESILQLNENNSQCLFSILNLVKEFDIKYPYLINVKRFSKIKNVQTKNRL